jgi:hypothetical protein
MTEGTLVDFDITIHGAQAPYGVSARYRTRTAEGEFAEEITQPAWQSAQAVLERAITTPDAAGIVAAGSRLYRALMRGQVRDLWISARADLEQERVAGLRLRLALQPPAVAALPWESLYDPDRNTPFAADSRTPLVRIEPLYAYVGPARRLRVSLPLKVLIAVPDDPDGALDAAQELAGVRQVLEAIGPSHLAVHVLAGRFGVVELRRQLQAVRADVLHFIGHGTPGALQLWQRDRPMLAPAASLRATLDRVRSVKLVFLNACLGARAVRLAPFTSVGAQLLQAGLPAVVAMQASIRDDAAIDFAHFLYEELVCGPCPGAIDLAVAAARSTLYALNPGDFSYATPVLWLNAEDGRIFVPNGSAAPGDAGANGPAPGLDLALEARWVEEMAALDLTRLPPEYGFLRSKWLNLLGELRSLLHQLRILAGDPASTAYTAKVVEFRRYQAALLRLKRLIEEAGHPTE